MGPTLRLPLSLPNSQFLRRAGVVLGVAALLVLSGCAALGDTGLPDGETAADRYISLDGYAGTAEVTYAGTTGAENQTVEIVARPATGESRIETQNPREVIIRNRTQILQYNAAEGELTRTTFEDAEDANRTQRERDRLRRLVDRARGGETGEVPGSPLPVVPAAGLSGETNTTRAEYSYAGTETILGRQAHVIRIQPIEGTSSRLVNRTVWLDAEWFVTLQTRSVQRVDGERVTRRFRFTNVTFDPELSDDPFTFDPPPGATVDETTSLERSTYDSRAALEAATDLSVPDPDLPKGVELEEAGLIAGEGERLVTMSYRRGTGGVFIQKSDSDETPTLPDGETVTVGNQTGRYVDAGTGASVIWTCDGVLYAVGGPLERDQLVAVAESMVCE